MIPPVLPRRLLRAVAPGEDRAAIIGDLDEEFRRRAATSRTAARAWYWRQALACLPPALRLRWRRAAPLADLPGDLRYAVRGMRAHPTFAAAAILTLALGAGVTTPIVAVVDAVLLRPLPYAHPDRIYMVQEFDRTGVGGGSRLSWSDLQNLSAHTHAFAAIAGFNGGSMTLTGNGPAQRLGAAAVTAPFFDVLGVAPAIGRTFRAEDEAPGAPRVVVLTHDAWTRRLGGDPSILGRPIVLDGQPHAVIGVLPASFIFPPRGTAELWLPIRPSRAQVERPYFHWIDAIASLRPGSTPAQAGDELASLSREWSAADAWHQSTGLRAISMRDDLVAGIRPALLVLLGAAALVLLAAAANVSGLVVSRAAGRTREMAVRATMGASRWRLARQLLIESALLGLAGAAGGLLLGAWSVRTFGASLPARYRAGLPYLDALSVTPRAAVLSLGLAGIAMGIAILTPILRLRTTRGAQALVTGLRATAGRSDTRLRRLLVAAQIALAAALLAGAALVGRSVIALTRVSPGFETAGLLTANVSLPGTRYAAADAVRTATSRILDAIRALPGVTGAEAINQLPLTGGGNNGSFSVAGRAVPKGEQPETLIRSVTPGYFGVMGIPLVEGRRLAPSDTPTSPHVVVVNQTLARRVFPDGAIGQRVVFEFFDGRPEWTIVGVVGDEQFEDLDRPMSPVLYFPDAQDTARSFSLVVRAALAPDRVAAPVRAAVAAIDPELPVYGVRTVERIASESSAMFLRTLVTTLLGWFAAATLLLAGVGIYGVLAESMAARTREIGVRMALGATRGRIARLVLAAGILPAAAGLGAGLVLIAIAGPSLRALLFGIVPFDVPSIAAVCIVIAAMALAASSVPAWRAVRMPVTTALRQE